MHDIEDTPLPRSPVPLFIHLRPLFVGQASEQETLLPLQLGQVLL